MVVFGAEAAFSNSVRIAGAGAATYGVGSGTESSGLASVEPVGVRLVLILSQCSLDSSLLLRIK